MITGFMFIKQLGTGAPCRRFADVKLKNHYKALICRQYSPTMMPESKVEDIYGDNGQSGP